MLLLAPLEKRLASPGERQGPSWKLGDGGLLSALLIVAVLLCHGVLGAAHQVSCNACETAQPQMAHHGVAAETGADEGGNAVDGQAGGVGKTAYAAILVTLLGAATLGLIGIARVWLEAPGSRALWRRLIPLVFHRQRGPSLPSLQVFRL